jgi:hypothetical protein
MASMTVDYVVYGEGTGLNGEEARMRLIISEDVADEDVDREITVPDKIRTGAEEAARHWGIKDFVITSTTSISITPPLPKRTSVL